jgi:hypothetical protein
MSLIAAISPAYLFWSPAVYPASLQLSFLCLTASGWALWPIWIKKLKFFWIFHPLQFHAAFWVIISISVHFMPLVFPSSLYKSYIFSIVGAVLIVLMLRSSLIALKSMIQKFFPTFYYYVYGSESALYFNSAFIAVTVAAILAAIGSDRIAKQFGVATYFALSVGVVIELLAYVSAKVCNDPLKNSTGGIVEREHF